MTLKRRAVRVVRIAGSLRQKLFASSKSLFRGLGFCTMLLFVSSAGAANVYVREGGNGDGSDWDNALNQLPPTLVRGDVYYVADGTYPGGSISVPRSGTSHIYIKKASTADHGTSLGWDDSYGDGIATFGTWGINGETGYITFDGSYEYGFRFVGEDVPLGSVFFIRNSSNGSIPNFTLKYVDIVGPGDGSDRYPWINATRAIWIGGGSGPTYPNMTFSHCKMRGFTTLFFLEGAHNLLVEYCDLSYATSSNPDAHSNVGFLSNCDNVTFRYNRMHHFDVVGVVVNAGGDNYKVYGNVCYATRNGATRFFQLYRGYTYQNHAYYNNTLVDLWMGLRIEGVNSDHTAYNNLMYNVGGNVWADGVEHDYNWYGGGGSVSSEPNGVSGGSSQPFVNYAAANFNVVGTLSTTMPRNKGTALPAEYATDFAGHVRGSDGVWDIGAYEFGTASTNPVIAVSPASLGFGVVESGSTNDLTFTVRNVGGGTLAGSVAAAPPFNVLSGSAYTLSGGQSQTVTLRYRPGAAGTHDTSVVCSGGGGVIVPVTAEAFAPTAGL